MSMENHSGMMMLAEENLLVHGSSLAIVPAVIWEQGGEMEERSETAVL
jgi:hypothetical protein